MSSPLNPDPSPQRASDGVAALRQATLPRTVLVVDDSETARDRVVGLIRGLGLPVEILSASNSREALTLARERSVTAVVTDKDMDSINEGNHLARELKRSTLPPVILGLTGGNPAHFERAVVNIPCSKDQPDSVLSRVLRQFLSGEDPRSINDQLTSTSRELLLAVIILASGYTAAHDVASGKMKVPGLRLVPLEKAQAILDLSTIDPEGTSASWQNALLYCDWASSPPVWGPKARAFIEKLVNGQGNSIAYAEAVAFHEEAKAGLGGEL